MRATGYNVREGSVILAKLRAKREAERIEAARKARGSFVRYLDKRLCGVTGCERILARLEQGPATAAELYATTYTVVHSRIADLRKRGHVITCEHVGGDGAASYLYTLAGEPSGSLPTPDGGPRSEAVTAVAAPSVASPAQLSLEAA